MTTTRPKPVFDLSFSWPTITGSKLVAAGAGGVIAYAGCLEVTKNVSKERVQDWLDSGLMVGLVVEDFAGDAIGGEQVGRDQGKRLADAADARGYDVPNCVLAGGYDTDAHPGDYRHLAEYMHGFAAEIPVPGYYGDSDSIDYLATHGPDLINWQSSSGSFSPLNPTPNAHLHQRYADPRAHGLDVDVNDVLRTPLRLMGEDMLDPQDVIDQLLLPKNAKALGTALEPAIERALRKTVVDGKGGTMAQYVRQIRAALDPKQIADEIAAQLPAGHGATADQIAAKVDERLRAIFADAGDPSS
jgi:hypothetical protein